MLLMVQFIVRGEPLGPVPSDPLILLLNVHGSHVGDVVFGIVLLVRCRLGVDRLSLMEVAEVVPVYGGEGVAGFGEDEDGDEGESY